MKKIFLISLVSFKLFLLTFVIFLFAIYKHLTENLGADEVTILFTMSFILALLSITGFILARKAVEESKHNRFKPWPIILKAFLEGFIHKK